MGHRKVGVPSRRYANEFNVEAVKLGLSVGVSEASRRLGMPDSSLFNCVKLGARRQARVREGSQPDAAIGERA